MLDADIDLVSDLDIIDEWVYFFKLFGKKNHLILFFLCLAGMQ